MTRKFNEGDMVEVVRKVGDGDMSYDVGDTFTISSGTTQSGAYGTIYETIEGTWVYDSEIERYLAGEITKSLSQAIAEQQFFGGEHGMVTPGKRAPSHDSVKSPAHYANSKIETIDYMADKLPAYTDGFTAHCAGNVIKYVSRAPHKHETPLEDLRKARQYLDFAIAHEEGKLE